MNAKVDALAILCAVACTVVVAVRVAGAPREPSGPPATPAQRASFAANVSGNEPSWRRSTEQDFPSDLWSQRDAFHNHEAQMIRDLAAGAHVSYEDVIRAIDEDVRRGGQAGHDRAAAAIPCKPRPFYD
jgi:hypothetical protein